MSVHTRRHRMRLALAVCTGGMVCAWSVASAGAPLQPASPASAPAQPTKPGEGKPKPPGGLRSLDEQLGLTPSGEAGAPSAPGAAPTNAPTPTQQDLRDRLSDTKLEDSFREAIALMNRAASRLSEHADTGIDTQRIQEEAIRRLEQTLSEAKKRQQQKQQQSSSSSSSQGQSQPQQTDAQGQQPQQGEQGLTPEQRAAQAAAERAARARQSDANLDPPAREREALRAALEASRAAWGNLPERVRQSLMQGSGEKFSTVYQQMTVDYYKRLAEQSAGGGGGTRGTGGGGR